MTSFIFNPFVQCFSEGHFLQLLLPLVHLFVQFDISKKTRYPKMELSNHYMHKQLVYDQNQYLILGILGAETFFVQTETLISLHKISLFLHLMALHSNNLAFGDFKCPFLWRPLSVRTK